MRVTLLAFVVLTLQGCATRPLQTDTFFKSQHNLPQSAKIEGVPFIEQEVGHCGPASLAMVMNWAGKKTSAQELASQVYTPGMKGSLQLDMVSATRRNGMMAIPIEGINSLLTEIAAGHPVIVFENLGLSWLPQWHYAVVHGYDLQKRTLTMHSGPKAEEVWKMWRFEKDWRLGEYWGLVVLPPGKLARSADELTHVKAAAALEQLKLADQAYVSYRAVLERWPQSLAANIGAANIAYERKEHSSAVKYLRTATEAHPQSASAWHNLAIALQAAKKKKEARSSAKQALALATSEERPAFEQSLKDLL